MTYRNRPLYAAVAACFGVVAGQAVAVDLTSASTSAKFAKELPITSTTTLVLVNFGGLLDIRIPTVSGFSPTAVNPLYIKIALSNNAKFTTVPVVTCSAITGGSAGGEATSVTGSVIFGGAGASTVTFQLTAAGAAGANAKLTGASGCVISASNVTITAQIADIVASAQYEYVNGIQQVVSGFNNSYITFVRGVTATVSAGAGVIVDAIGGSTRFTAGSNGGTALGNLGKVNVFGNGTGVSAAGAFTLSAGDAIQSATLTVSGPIVSVGLQLGNSGMFLSNAADCSVKSELISNSAGSSVTFQMSGGTLAQLSAASGYAVCVNVSGNTTQLLTGQITAVFTPTPQTNVTADLSTPSPNLANLTQNGTTKNAYFMNASTSAAKSSRIRIINTGNAGTLRATAFDESGTQVGTANGVLGAIASGQMLSLTSAQVETILNIPSPAPTSKYRLVVTGNVAGFKIINFVQDIATGQINLGQAQDD